MRPLIGLIIALSGIILSTAIYIANKRTVRAKLIHWNPPMFLQHIKKTIDKAVLFEEKSIRKAELYVNEIYITD
jgi:hypothetical protein